MEWIVVLAFVGAATAAFASLLGVSLQDLNPRTHKSRRIGLMHDAAMTLAYAQAEFYENNGHYGNLADLLSQDPLNKCLQRAYRLQETSYSTPLKDKDIRLGARQQSFVWQRTLKAFSPGDDAHFKVWGDAKGVSYEPQTPEWCGNEDKPIFIEITE